MHCTFLHSRSLLAQDPIWSCSCSALWSQPVTFFLLLRFLEWNRDWLLDISKQKQLGPHTTGELSVDKLHPNTQFQSNHHKRSPNWSSSAMITLWLWPVIGLVQTQWHCYGDWLYGAIYTIFDFSDLRKQIGLHGPSPNSLLLQAWKVDMMLAVIFS